MNFFNHFASPTPRRCRLRGVVCSAAAAVSLALTGFTVTGPPLHTAEQSAMALAATNTLANRTAQVPGSYKPAAATTGVIAGTKLAKYNQSGTDLVITRDNTVLENLEIYGDIKVRAKNVVIRNSLLRGGSGAPANPTAVVDATGSQVVNLRIEDSTIRPDRPHYNRDGIKGTISLLGGTTFRAPRMEWESSTVPAAAWPRT